VTSQNYGHNTIAILWVGNNTTLCVELNGKDLPCYSNKIESVSLRKCPYDHWLTNKAYLSAITVTNIYQSFTYKMATEIDRHRYGTKLRHCHPMYLQHFNIDYFTLHYISLHYIHYCWVSSSAVVAMSWLLLGLFRFIARNCLRL